jgi:hypothetical protein
MNMIVENLTAPPDEARRGRILKTIGGSAAPIIMGCSQYSSPQQLNRRMRDLIHRGVLPEQTDSRDAERGRMFEAQALSATARTLGITVLGTEVHITHPKYPWAHAHIDGQEGGDCLGRVIPVEVKCPRPHRFDAIASSGVLPEEWMWQALHNMLACYSDRIHFGVFCVLTARVAAMTLHLYEDFPLDASEKLMSAEKHFYESVSLDLEWTPPPGDIVDLESGYDGTNGEDLIAATETGIRQIETNEAYEAGREYVEAVGIKSAAEELLDDAKSRLIDLLGGHGSAEIPGLLRMHYRQAPGRRTFDADLAKREYPALRDERFHKVGKPYDSFRVYERGATK